MSNTHATGKHRARVRERAPCYAEAANDAIRGHDGPGCLTLVNVTHAATCEAMKTGDPFACDCAPDIAALVACGDEG